jgi:CRISPR/Cas system-associated exonuclease Cas4 (RecB family)
LRIIGSVLDLILHITFFYSSQRAAQENVSILYNSKSEGLNTGEPGRYIHQLKYLSAYNPEFKSVSFRIAEKKAVEINIVKTPEIFEKLKDFSENGSLYLSPSALGSYLDCSMKFYFTYIAGIREEDEVNEDIDASGLGTLFHDTLENLYKEHEGKLITKELLKQMSDPGIVKEKLDDAFRKVFHPHQDKSIEIKPEGRNIIVYEIIRKMVIQTLVQDAEFAEFRFIKAEEKIKINFTDPESGKIFRVGGKIDRIDERNGVLHLIDYKTGKASIKFKGLAALFDRDSWGVNDYYKAVFQVFMYCWLYAEMSGRKDIVPAIYRTSELFSQEFKTYLEDIGNCEVLDYSKYHDEFDSSLLKLLNEIFDPEVPFKQTTDEVRCTYCPYAGICHRSK